MGDQEQKRKPGVGAGGDQDAEDGAERAFDLWLRRGLHRLYDGVASEPVPPALLRLIDADRARRRG